VKTLIHILFLCLSSICFAQQNIEIELPPLPKELTPGQYISLFYTVRNADKLDNLEPRLQLPTDWKIITEKQIRVSDTPSVKRFIYTITLPNQAAARDYSIDFQLIEDRKIVANKKTNIAVAQVRRVEITVMNQPEYVKEGDVLRVEYMIQNLGNQAEKLNLTTSRGSVEANSDSIVIAANSFLRVFVKQNIPNTEGGNWQAGSDLKVFLPNQIAPIHASVSIPVFSTKDQNHDPYLRFPIQIGGGYLTYMLGNQKISGYQYHATGRGHLDFEKKHFAEFTIRGPNQFLFPAIGNFDEYNLEYVYDSTTHVTLGDYNFRFNNLMEFGRFGRGAKVEQHFKNGYVMAFYQQTRFFPLQKDGFGGRYARYLKHNTRLTVDFMSKNLTEKDRDFRSNLLGITALTQKKYWKNEAELSVGQAKHKTDIGGFNRFTLSYKRWSGSSEMMYTGKNFYGFYANSTLLVNALNYAFNAKWQAGFNSNLIRINPSLDLTRYNTSPFSFSNMAYVSFQANPKNMISANFTRQEREDRQTPSQFNFKEDFGNLNYHFNNGNLSVMAQARYGFSENLLVVDSTRRQESTSFVLQPTYNPTSWLSVGGYFEHQRTTKFSTTDSYQNLLFYGGNLRLYYKNIVNLSFMYRNNYAPDEFFQQRSFIDGSLSVDWRQHQLSIVTGRAFLPNLPQNNQNIFFLSAKYVVRLNVPVRKDKHVGQIRGEITGLTNDIQRGGVLVQLGNYKTLTDSMGRFSFSNLRPDKYHISLPKRLEVGVVPTVKIPVEVVVKADSTAVVQIPLTKTGGVIGKIFFLDSAQNLVNTPLSKPTIFLKMSNGKERFMTQMTDKNEFSFKEMKPDRWQIEAVLVNNTDQFELLNTEQEVVIEANQLKETTFSVRTLTRKIQFSGRNFQIKAEKK
jgi:hypothetical protein